MSCFFFFFFFVNSSDTDTILQHLTLPSANKISKFQNPKNNKGRPSISIYVQEYSSLYPPPPPKKIYRA